MCFLKTRAGARRVIGAVLVAALLAGCASAPNRLTDPRDPLEPVNRAVFRFNSDFDKAFMVPLAKGYKAITPEPVNRGITIAARQPMIITTSISSIMVKPARKPVGNRKSEVRSPKRQNKCFLFFPPSAFRLLSSKLFKSTSS